MELDLAQQRLEAHLLVDALPQEKLQVLRSTLDTLVEPLSASLAAAPFEEEELTAETIAAIQQGDLDYEQGRTTSHDEMLREFGG